MQTTLTKHNIATFDRFASVCDGFGPDWYRPARQQAFARFAELGLPTTRHEQWQFTKIRPIAETAFELAVSAGDVDAVDLAGVAIGGLRGHRLVFVDGHYQATWSQLAEGLEVLSLAEAFDRRQDLIEPYIGKLADVKQDAFTALNAALTTDGAVVYVPDGQVVEDPICLVNLTSRTDRPLLANPRNLVVVGKHAAVTVVEDYVSLRDDVYFNNAVTEIEVGADADVKHYLLQRESTRAFNISSLYVRQQRDSRFSSHSVLLGGAITRNNIESVLDGEHCWSQLNGLYAVGGTQQVDNYMRVVHARPHGDSRQYYKGIIRDHGSGVFRGRIVVRPGAQKTDAVQSNQNLLLSAEASANSDPQLEIYADDVKCTHGSTTGMLDEAQIFYLKTRGIGEEVARAMIVYAFAAESLERMEIGPIRSFLQQKILSQLSAAKVLAPLL